MTTADTGPDVRVELTGAAAFFRGLGDPTRLAILRALAGGEARLIDLTLRFGLPQSTVSAHVACLRGCGLVEGRPEGRQVFYSLTQSELLDVLRAAESVLAVIGTQVQLCDNYGAKPNDPHAIQGADRARG